MVAKGHGVVSHQVHRLYFCLSLEKVEVGGALQEITRIEEQQVFMLSTHLLDIVDAPLHTTLVGSIAVACGQWLDAAVGIVGMQDH